MGKLNIELCPETGICSIIKADGAKIDLMPDEVDNLRQAGNITDGIKKAIAEVDSQFAEKLDLEELKQLSSELK
ncbi:MAG: hypothetical protein WCI51_16090 [Lentisphaerota bacterium]